MESYEENAAVLGQISGKETEVSAELDNVPASIEALNAKVTAADKKALSILANDGSISANGSGSAMPQQEGSPA
ncbi:hypothetical protein [Paenibacillus sp. S150]|uniref:hypothetical protein n=1 Tax=Paenibacillus sp. S150 TaxID=2749826 RepID=UPI001E36E41F|nr:hypothetical protein [Paenibacillus sp. S150]